MVTVKSIILVCALFISVYILETIIKNAICYFLVVKNTGNTDPGRLISTWKIIMFAFVWAFFYAATLLG